MYFKNVLQFLLPSNNEALVVKICEANLVTCEYIQNCAKIEINAKIQNCVLMLLDNIIMGRHST